MTTNMDAYNEWHQAQVALLPPSEQAYTHIVPRVKCKDGFTVSIQASKGNYSSPRENRSWPYSSFELGFPSKEDSLINKYAEDKNYTKTVYGFVPLKVVLKLLAKHGGIKT